MNNKLKTVLIGAGLAVILFLSFFLRYLSFNRTPFAVGADGYYHIIQAKSFLETGKTHSPDYSLTPYTLALVYRVVGDWEQAQKVLLGLLCAVISGLAFVLGYRMSRRKMDKYYSAVPALLLALLFAVSPTITYIAAQFMKQLFGLAAFMLFLIFYDYTAALVRRANRDKLSDKRIIVGGIFTILAAALTMFAHRLNGVMALLGFFFLMNKRLLIAGLITGAVLLVLGSVLVPGIISVLEIERFAGILSIVPSFHPASVLRFIPFNLGWFLEMLLPYGVLALSVWLAVKKIKGKEFYLSHTRWYLSLLLLLGIFPFYRFDSLDMGFRLFIGVIPLAYVALCGIPAVWKTKWAKWALAGGAVVLGTFSPFVFDPASNYAYPEYKNVIEKTEARLRERAIQPEIIIVHHGFSFYYTYVSGRHTLPFLPEWDYAPTNVYRLVYGISDAEMQYYLPAELPEKPVRFSPNYSLFREDVWQSLVTNCVNEPEMEKKVLSTRNPYKSRPRFMRKFKEPGGS